MRVVPKIGIFWRQGQASIPLKGHPGPHGRRLRLVLFGLGLLAILCGSLVTAGPASASTPWTVTSSPNLGSNQNNGLEAVSCPDATHCVAVGSYNGPTSQTLVETLSGGTWIVTPSPDQGTNQANALFGVSCSDAAHCVAVGEYSNGTAHQTLVETLSGGTWTITPSPDQGSNRANVLFGVSCSDAADCVAVGGYNNGTAGQTLVETLSGGTWTITPSPSQGTNRQNDLNGVSCSDVADCVAVGDYDSGTAGQTLVETLSGGTWTITPSPDQGTNQDNALLGVSCLDAANCVAAGEYSNGTVDQTLVETLSVGTWTVIPSPNQGTSQNNDLFGVSCSDAANCVAAGEYSNGTVDQTLVETLSGGTWTITPSPDQGTNQYNDLLGVSCSDEVHCSAVGDYSNGTVDQTLVLSGSVTQGGYDLAGSDGGVFVFPVGQSAGFFGSLPGLGVHVNNVVGIVPTNNDHGYDLVGTDGGVFVFPTGQASGFFGSLPGLGVHVNNVVGIVPTNNDDGYDLVGTDGGVFVFPIGQSSGFFGSLPGLGVQVNNIVGIVASPDGQGYFLVGRDGGVFTFGDAPFLGSLPQLGTHVSNITGIASTTDGRGYWVVGTNGAVYAFGDATKFGDLPGLGINVSNIVSLVPTPDAKGYFLIGSDGGTFAFGDAVSQGSLPGLGVSVNNVVGAVPTG